MGALAQDNPVWSSLSSRKSFLSFPAQPTRSAFNANVFAPLLQSSALNLKDFEWTEHERPLIAHNQFENDELIPVIDMAAFSSSQGMTGVTLSDAERQKAQKCVASQMAQASNEWGFFQVVNHDVPKDVVKKMEQHAREFFESLGLEQKKRILRDASANKPMGYACGGAGTRLKSDLPWIESLHLPSVTEEMDAFASKVWPDGNTEFRMVLNEFSKAMRRVSMRVMDVLVGKLVEEEEIRGLRKGGGRAAWEERVSGKDQASNSVVRFNYYPPCPQPALTLGLGAHSDPHLLTILHQDLVGGLQICKDGHWIAVKPKQNALVVNIGDALQVWSNDVYKSVEHRAVCNSVRSRLSMGFFLNPLDEAVISPVTTSSPLYKPFTWKEYRECMYTHRPRGKSNLLRFKK